MNFPKIIPIRFKGARWRKEKEKVLERDQGFCVFCNKYVGINSDPAHIIRRSNRGDDTADNLMTACRSCHEKFDQFRCGLPRKVWVRMDFEHREKYIKSRKTRLFQWEE